MNPKKLLATLGAGVLALCAVAPSATAEPAAGSKANGSSTAPGVTTNGRHVVFSSVATDLVTGDTNGRSDIFLRDIAFKKTKIVTKSYTGGPANGNSTEPQVSDDGRYVVYMSDATNLVPGDTNGKTDIFRTDMTTMKTTRISTSQSGAQANGVSKRPRINSAATVIAYVSTAPNLVPGDTNRIQDIFVRNLNNNSVKRISVSPTGAQLSVMPFSPSVSYDGKIVGFHTDAYANPTVNSYCGRTADALSVIMKWTVSTSKSSITEVVCRESGVRRQVYEPRANMQNKVGYTVASDYGYTQFFARGLYNLYDSIYEGSSYSTPYWDVARWGGTMVTTNSATDEVRVSDQYGVQNTYWFGTDSLAMSPDGAYVAMRSTSSGQIYLWNWNSGSLVLVSTK